MFFFQAGWFDGDYRRLKEAAKKLTKAMKKVGKLIGQSDGYEDDFKKVECVKRIIEEIIKVQNAQKRFDRALQHYRENLDRVYNEADVHMASVEEYIQPK